MVAEFVDPTARPEYKATSHSVDEDLRTTHFKVLWVVAVSEWHTLTFNSSAIRTTILLMFPRTNWIMPKLQLPFVNATR